MPQSPPLGRFSDILESSVVYTTAVTDGQPIPHVIRAVRHIGPDAPVPAFHPTRDAFGSGQYAVRWR